MSRGWPTFNILPLPMDSPLVERFGRRTLRRSLFLSNCRIPCYPICIRLLLAYQLHGSYGTSAVVLSFMNGERYTMNCSGYLHAL